MLKRIFTIALRQLKSRTSFTLINISGLSVGLAASILLALFVYHERSMDNFHTHKDKIYRFTEEHVYEGSSASTYFPLYSSFHTDYPAVEAIARLYPAKGTTGIDNNQKFTEPNVYYADPGVFEIFSFPLALGDTADFAQPNSVIISAGLSQKYFGNVNPIGRSVTYENLLTHEDQEGVKRLKVVGVLAAIPHNSHLRFDMLISMPTLGSVEQWEKYGWHFPPVYTYLTLSDTSAVQKIEEASRQILVERVHDQNRRFHLQPLSDIHLRSGLNNEIHAGGSEQLVQVFMVTALLVLCLAIFNYVNLATARGLARAREVGVKKTLGASRGGLIGQFLAESFVMVGMAGIIAFTLVQVALPWTSAVFGVDLRPISLFSWQFGLLLVAGLGVVALLAGFYPAFVLSSYKPANIIRGRLLSSPGGVWLRRLLVVTQFTIAIVLIASTLVINDQLQFIQYKDLGFQKENTLVVNIDFPEFNTSVLKERLLAQPLVQDVTQTSNLIGTDDRLYAYPVDFESNTEAEELELSVLTADARTDDFFELEMVSGRYFSQEFPSDFSSGLVINEAAAELLGWDDAVNKDLTIKYINQGKDHAGRVIGVVKDFHIRSLHHKIEPLVIIAAAEPEKTDFYDFMLVKTQRGSSPAKVMAEVDELWSSLGTGKPLEAYFLDDRINRLYQQEARTARLFSWFAAISIFISCLGLYGMSSYTAQLKRKEICIRKILGATTLRIVARLSKSYLALIGVAGVAGSLMAYRLGSGWLQDFAYRVEISLWVFILTIVAAVAIAMFTIAQQAFKAATENPVNALREE